jgi:hypothetical protein
VVCEPCQSVGGGCPDPGHPGRRRGVSLTKLR